VSEFPPTNDTVVNSLYYRCNTVVETMKNYNCEPGQRNNCLTFNESCHLRIEDQSQLVGVLAEVFLVTDPSLVSLDHEGILDNALLMFRGSTSV